MVNGKSRSGRGDLTCDYCQATGFTKSTLRTHFGQRHFDDAMAALNGEGAVKLAPDFFEFPGAHLMGAFEPLRRNKGLALLPVLLGGLTYASLPAPLSYVVPPAAALMAMIAVWLLAAAKETQRCWRSTEFNDMVIWQFDYMDRRELYDRDGDRLVSRLPEECWKDYGHKRIPVIDTALVEHSQPFNPYRGESGITDTVVASKTEHSDSIVTQIRPFNITSAAAVRLGGMILITGIFAVVDYLLFQSIVDFNTAQQALASAR